MAMQNEKGIAKRIAESDLWIWEGQSVDVEMEIVVRMKRREFRPL